MNEVKIFFFGLGDAIPSQANAHNVGNKAYSLIRLSKLGLPVPPGFALPSFFCDEYYAHGRALPEGLTGSLSSGIKQLQEGTRLNFGGRRRPLLVAVRSGAAVSMPGMLDTLLNIGLCDATVNGLLRLIGNPRVAWDSYRRLIQSFAETVWRCPAAPFDEALARRLRAGQLATAQELDAEALEALTQDFLEVFSNLTGRPFPQNPMDQLLAAVEAVLQSWESPQAVEYRRLHGIPALPGTAVTVQTMVFGNTGSKSGAGVAFTRNPANGENQLYVDYISNAQGEDIVSGKHTPESFDDLQRILPGVYSELKRIRQLVELEFKDAQDIEFTVQEGSLYLLQTRDAKRTPWAALHIAVDLANEGLIDEATAIQRMQGYDLDKIELHTLAGASDFTPLAHAVPASPGVVSGAIAFSVDACRTFTAMGKPVILVREEFSPTDIIGVTLAQGILATCGGKTSHAAVVARQMNKVCLVGCRDLLIDFHARRCALGQVTLEEGDEITLDGNMGKVYRGKIAVKVEKPEQFLAEIRAWRSRSG